MANFITMRRRDGRGSEYRVNLDLIKWYYPDNEGTTFIMTDGLGNITVDHDVKEVDKILGTKTLTENGVAGLCLRGLTTGAMHRSGLDITWQHRA